MTHYEIMVLRLLVAILERVMAHETFSPTPDAIRLYNREAQEIISDANKLIDAERKEDRR